MKRISIAVLTLIGINFFLSCNTEKETPPAALAYAGEDPRVQLPLSPEESQKHIQLPEGFTAELFAAEPDIINPIAFTWDERGRLWVVQSQDYPHKLANDVGGDRITICEDTDGDGKADKFTDFATDQSLSTGIVKVDGGIIVSQAPEMVFLEDTDGDDKMDKRTVLFDGFGTWDTHAGPSSLRYGIDNALWGAVGYSDFKNKFEGDSVIFDMGVYRFGKDGSFLEPVGQFDNNTWGMGYNENFEIFGSTANNNHACFVGIPLRSYSYLDEVPSWGMNADFIQGHYEISPADTVPLQQVDVRGGYTAAAGANFYTARNYPEKYQNQMYVNAPTGHLVHMAKMVRDGAGYQEEDGGNIFASTDAWTAPVFTETGPDGNLWVADWYNPVIQHNPDKRGMENQIWNDDKGEGNAHINKFRDYRHGRIYIIKYKDAPEPEITALDAEDGQALLSALQSDNLFWRVTAQRLIVEGRKTDLVPDLIAMIEDAPGLEDHSANQNIDGSDGDRETGTHNSDATALHALWILDGLGVFEGGDHDQLLSTALNRGSYKVRRAAMALLPDNDKGAEALLTSESLTDSDLRLRLAAMLKATQFRGNDQINAAMEEASEVEENTSDQWLNAAIKIYFKEPDVEEDPKDRPDNKAPDISITLNTVPQKMAYDQIKLEAKAGQTVEIKLNNPDMMPHNLVVIKPGTLDAFGGMVDDYVSTENAENTGYVPPTGYVLGATEMLDPNESGSVIFTLPDEPGTYPFVCTFPGHWRFMQGEIIVTAAESESSGDSDV